jgi:hypothetical protein
MRAPEGAAYSRILPAEGLDFIKWNALQCLTCQPALVRVYGYTSRASGAKALSLPIANHP